MQALGRHLLLELFDCDSDAINNLEAVKGALVEAAKRAQATIVAVTISADPERDWLAIVIEDNAGGIETSTIKSVLDYSIRVSSREAYVSPTRGASRSRSSSRPRT